MYKESFYIKASDVRDRNEPSIIVENLKTVYNELVRNSFYSEAELVKNHIISINDALRNPKKETDIEKYVSEELSTQFLNSI